MRVAWLGPTVPGALLMLGAPAIRPTWLAPGAPGTVLRTEPGGSLGWVVPSAAALPITTPGDLIVGDASGSAARLARGETGQSLRVEPTGLLDWYTPPANPMIGAGDLIVGLAGGVPDRLAPGASSQVLTVVGTAPTWVTPPAPGMPNPMSQAGDLILGGGGGTPTRLGIGPDGYVLTLLGGMPAWRAPSGGTGGGGTMDNPMTAVGDLIVGSTAGDPVRLPIGTADQILSVNATGQPIWRTLTASEVLSGEWTWLATPTAGPPIAEGQIAFDNIATPTTVVAAVINGTGVDTSQVFLALQDGDSIYIQDQSNSTRWRRLRVTGIATVGSGAAVIPVVEYGATQGADFTDAETVQVAIGLTTSAGSALSNPMTTLGDLIVGAASGVPGRLGVGTNGQVLTLASGVPGWQAPIGFANPMVAAGDLIVGASGGLAGRLAIGADGAVLTLVSGVPTWATGAAGLTWPLLAPDGLSTAPSYSFASAPAVGLFLSGTDLVLTADAGRALRFTSGGAARWVMDVAGMLTPAVDGASDVGSAALRVRDLHLSRQTVYAALGGAPVTPAAGKLALYGKNDKRLYVKDDAGLETLLGAGLVNPMTAPGDLITGGTAGAPTRLAIGAANQVLTVISGVPTWQPLTALTNPMIAVGDLIVGGASGAPTRLAAPVTGQVLASAGVGVAPVWSASPTLTSLVSPIVDFPTGTAPATPSANRVRLYAKTDKKLYQKDDAGVETPLGGGGGPTTEVLPIVQADLPDGTGTQNAPPVFQRWVGTAPRAGFPKITRTVAWFDPAIRQFLMWTRMLPANYGSGGALRLKWYIQSTAGDVYWLVGAWPTSDGVAEGANTWSCVGTSIVPVSSGGTYVIRETLISLSPTTELAANREVCFSVGRASDAIEDTAVDIAILVAARFEYTPA